MGDESLAKLAPVLSKCETLRDLSLSRCSLSDRAAEHIAIIMRAHSKRRSDQRWVSGLRDEVRIHKEPGQKPGQTNSN